MIENLYHEWLPYVEENGFSIGTTIDSLNRESAEIPRFPTVSDLPLKCHEQGCNKEARLLSTTRHRLKRAPNKQQNHTKSHLALKADSAKNERGRGHHEQQEDFERLLRVQVTPNNACKKIL